MRPPGQIAHGSHPSGPLLGAPQQRALPNTFQCRSFQPNPAHAQQAALQPAGFKTSSYPGRGASIGRLLALVIWIENMSHMSKSVK